MCNNKNPTIAIIDSGIGGVSILKQLIDKYKAGNYIYFADNLYMPYGNKDKKWLNRRVGEIISLLNDTYKVGHIIVACNTASSAINQRKYKNVTLMQFNEDYVYFATKTTKKNLSNLNVIADSNLAKEIEKNILNKSKLETTIKRHTQYHALDELKQVVLGCTHYELVKDIFSKYCKNSEVLCNSKFVIDNCHFDILNQELNIVVMQSKRDISLEYKINKLLGR